jgi:hypothetical protein
VIQAEPDSLAEGLVGTWNQILQHDQAAHNQEGEKSGSEMKWNGEKEIQRDAFEIYLPAIAERTQAKGGISFALIQMLFHYNTTTSRGPMKDFFHIDPRTKEGLYRLLRCKGIITHVTCQCWGWDPRLESGE